MGEHIEEFNEQQQVRRARVTAITLAIFLVVALVSLVFAFSQKTELGKERVLREQMQQELTEAKQLAKRSREEAELQRAIAEENSKKAMQALHDCEQNKNN